MAKKGGRRLFGVERDRQESELRMRLDVRYRGHGRRLNSGVAAAADQIELVARGFRHRPGATDFRDQMGKPARVELRFRASAFHHQVKAHAASAGCWKALLLMS